MEGFTDEGNFYLSIYSQGSDEWKEQRKNRITASEFGIASGLFTKYETQDEYINNKINQKQREIEDFNISCMENGIRNEPVARKLYEKERNLKVKEIGLAVPKFNTEIGASVDGLVGEDGIIEIKCPYKLYDELKLYNYYLNKGKKIENLEINVSHYCQIQGCLKILNRKWCDYTVYVNEKLYIYRIDYDENFWDLILYPKLLSSLKKIKDEHA